MAFGLWITDTCDLHMAFVWPLASEALTLVTSMRSHCGTRDLPMTSRLCIAS